jgi:DUF4097 and DUF4098 domain-containing protein YvlB
MAAPTITRRAMLASTGTALAALSGCVAAGDSQETTEAETRTFDAEGTTLEVDNVNGPITVEESDTDEIVVDLEKTGTDDERDVTNVVSTRTDGRLTVETELDSRPFGGLLGPNTAHVSMAIQCPSDATVEHVETTNGDLRVRNVAGPVEIETTNGDITASGLDSVGDVSSTNGDIDVTVLAIEDDVAIESVNGEIDAALGPDLNADVRAETTVGEVTVDGDFGLASDDDTTGGSVSGTLGDGGPELSIESTNGGITLSGAD